MERQHPEALVELGTATRQTKGGPVGKEDQDRTFIPPLGLIED